MYPLLIRVGSICNATLWDVLSSWKQSESIDNAELLSVMSRHSFWWQLCNKLSMNESSGSACNKLTKHTVIVRMLLRFFDGGDFEFQLIPLLPKNRIYSIISPNYNVSKTLWSSASTSSRTKSITTLSSLNDRHSITTFIGISLAARAYSVMRLVKLSWSISFSVFDRTCWRFAFHSEIFPMRVLKKVLLLCCLHFVVTSAKAMQQ